MDIYSQKPMTICIFFKTIEAVLAKTRYVIGKTFFTLRYMHNIFSNQEYHDQEKILSVMTDFFRTVETASRLPPLELPRETASPSLAAGLLILQDTCYKNAIETILKLHFQSDAKDYIKTGYQDGKNLELDNAFENPEQNPSFTEKLGELFLDFKEYEACSKDILLALEEAYEADSSKNIHFNEKTILNFTNDGRREFHKKFDAIFTEARYTEFLDKFNAPRERPAGETTFLSHEEKYILRQCLTSNRGYADNRTTRYFSEKISHESSLAKWNKENDDWRYFVNNAIYFDEKCFFIITMEDGIKKLRYETVYEILNKRNLFSKDNLSNVQEEASPEKMLLQSASAVIDVYSDLLQGKEYLTLRDTLEKLADLSGVANIDIKKAHDMLLFENSSLGAQVGKTMHYFPNVNETERSANKTSIKEKLALYYINLLHLFFRNTDEDSRTARAKQLVQYIFPIDKNPLAGGFGTAMASLIGTPTGVAFARLLSTIADEDTSARDALLLRFGSLSEDSDYYGTNSDELSGPMNYYDRLCKEHLPSSPRSTEMLDILSQAGLMHKATASSLSDVGQLIKGNSSWNVRAHAKIPFKKRKLPEALASVSNLNAGIDTDTSLSFDSLEKEIRFFLPKLLDLAKENVKKHEDIYWAKQHALDEPLPSKGPGAISYALLAAFDQMSYQQNLGHETNRTEKTAWDHFSFKIKLSEERQKYERCALDRMKSPELINLAVEALSGFATYAENSDAHYSDNLLSRIGSVTSDIAEKISAKTQWSRTEIDQIISKTSRYKYGQTHQAIDFDRLKMDISQLEKGQSYINTAISSLEKMKRKIESDIFQLNEGMSHPGDETHRRQRKLKHLEVFENRIHHLKMLEMELGVAEAQAISLIALNETKETLRESNNQQIASLAAGQSGIRLSVPGRFDTHNRASTSGVNDLLHNVNRFSEAGPSNATAHTGRAIGAPVKNAPRKRQREMSKKMLTH